MSRASFLIPPYKMNTNTQSISLFAAFLLATPGHLAGQATLFAEDFGGDVVTELNETVPETTVDGVGWIASSNFKTDGSFGGNAGSATLAFAPVDGVVYQLDASVTVTGTSANWLALGYVSGQSTTLGISNRFVNGNVTLGRAWMLVRGSNVDFPNAVHTETTNDAVTWAGALANADGGDLDLRIVLDTTGGAGAWTATWFAKRPADATYLEVRSESVLPNEEINAVGFAVARNDVFGEIKSLTLTSDQTVAGNLPGIVAISRSAGGDVILTLDGPADGLMVQRSDDLAGFADVVSTSEGNTLTIAAANVDPNADGTDFFRIRE